MTLMNISSIDEITKNYDALIFDIWGVVYEGHNPYENAVNFINKMIRLNKKVIFLSNAPRPGILSYQRFVDWGINMNNVHVYTSGDQLREELINKNNERFKDPTLKFYHLGSERNQDLLANIDINITNDIKQANFLLLSLYVDEDENIQPYDDILKEAINLKLPAICANPDLTVNYNNKIRYCSGSFAKKYTELNGIVHYYGKPESRIFNLILNRYLSDYDRSKILMIGDTIETDIVGAKQVDIDSALVLTGNGQKYLNNQNAFKDCQAKPTWVSYGIGY